MVGLYLVSGQLPAQCWTQDLASFVCVWHTYPVLMRLVFLTLSERLRPFRFKKKCHYSVRQTGLYLFCPNQFIRDRIILACTCIIICNDVHFSSENVSNINGFFFAKLSSIPFEGIKAPSTYYQRLGFVAHRFVFASVFIILHKRVYHEVHILFNGSTI